MILSTEQWVSMHMPTNEAFAQAIKDRGWKLSKWVNGRPIFDPEVDEKAVSELALTCFRGETPKKERKTKSGPEPETKPKKRRGRPKGSKNKAKREKS